MSESTWHLIDLDHEIGWTYVMDVPGGALYMVVGIKREKLKFSPWCENPIPGAGVDYNAYTGYTQTVASKLPPRVVFVPGASVAIEQEKAKVKREAKEAKEKAARDAYKILEEAIKSSGNEVIDYGGSFPVCANIKCPGNFRMLVKGFAGFGSSVVSIQGHRFKTQEVHSGSLSGVLFELVQP